MTCLDAPAEVRAEWADDHGLDGVEGAGVGRGRGDDRARARRRAAPRSIPPKDELIRRGAAALGWESAVIRRNATDCGDCGSCPFGCRRGREAIGDPGAPRGRGRARARGSLDRARVTRCSSRPAGTTGVAGRLSPRSRSTGSRHARRRPDAARSVAVVRAPQVVLAAGALRSPGDPPGVGHRAPGDRAVPAPPPGAGRAARCDEPVDMWRGTMQAVRSMEFGQGDATGAGATSSNRRRATSGCWRWSCRGRARRRHAELMARARHFAPLIAITRDGGEGRYELTRAGRVRIDYRLDDARASRRRATPSSRWPAWRAPAARARVVAVGMPPLRPPPGVAGAAPTRRDARSRRFERSLGGDGLQPNRGAVALPTRWARCGWARPPWNTRPIRAAGSGATPRARSSPASTSPTARRSRPASA